MGGWARCGVVALGLLWAGCVDGDKGAEDSAAGELSDGGGDAGGEGGSPSSSDPALVGFIGSPCASDADCPYDGGLCLDAPPGGVCSLPCDSTCPDADGFPVTFCVDADLLGDPRLSGGGACVSRCDLGHYPSEGCRDAYGCSVEARFGEPETERYACLPGRPSELSVCHRELAAMGAPFEPTVIPPATPAGAPDAECSVQDAVLLRGPILGVALLGTSGDSPAALQTACEAGLALVDTIETVAPLGVVGLRHYGSYNCRVISGTSEVSRHGYGDAIDFYGFVFEDGDELTYVDDWVHEDPSPSDPGAAWLRDRAMQWHEERIWNVLLTPDYNAAHDDHVHADLTPGSDFYGRVRAPALGD